jgi:glycosyltransferase involved in cell wall biosynthesis
MLIIGRRKPNKGEEFGGVVVLYELFLDYFDREQIAYEVIDLNWRNYPSKMIFVLVIYFVLAKAILFSSHKKISFHGTTTDFTYYAPFVVFLSKLLDKRVTLRKFGGTFDQYYKKLGFVKKALVRYALQKADCVFYETKYLVRNLNYLNSNSVWFPNTRKAPKANTSDKFNGNIIFLGHVKKEKGIRELVDAANALNKYYNVDIYGPVVDNYLINQIEHSKASYKGIVQPDNVIKTLANYDVLALPSYSEGYPGVIIEALSVGLPIVATKLPSIKEIIKDGENGYLTEAKDSNALKEAFMRFDDNSYKIMKFRALDLFSQFDQEKVMRKVKKFL